MNEKKARDKGFSLPARKQSALNNKQHIKQFLTVNLGFVTGFEMSATLCYNFS